MNLRRQLLFTALCLLFAGGLFGQVAAITNVNVTLDENCQATLTPDQVLTGYSDSDNIDRITVRDGVCEDPSVNTNCVQFGDVVDGCGRFIWETRVNGTRYWGYVNAEDKTSPEIEYLPYGPSDLLCSEVDSVFVNSLDQSISRCWVQSGSGPETLNGSMNKELRAKLLNGGGIPDFRDGCSNVTICVTDVLVHNGDCGVDYIERSFTARDGDCPSVSGEENEPTIESYRIYLYRPSIEEVYAPAETAEYSCTEFSADDPNPVPEVEDYPFFYRPSGDVSREYDREKIFLSESICNLGATYQDGPRVSTCDNTYKFVRTWTVVDWCYSEYGPKIFTQTVKVGDFSGPDLVLPTQDRDFDGDADEGPLEFSTNSLDCAAYFAIPAGTATDSCDANPTVTAVVIPFDDEDALPIGPFAIGELAGPFPRTGEGEVHLLRYTAVDACGNKTTDEVEFVVLDKTAPVAICEDGLNISIGGSGVAIIDAYDIDRASYDECGDITLTIACVDENNEPIADDGDAGDDPKKPELYYDPTLPVDCDDLGTKRISLRVEDASGNVNYCWLDVLIEDKGAPICIPPASDRIVCTDLAGDFPEDLNDLFEADPAGTAALLDAQFGEANGVDNCEVASITQTVEDKRNSCGKGEIIRDFVVEDAQGLTSGGTCRQVITVGLVHDYTIVLPGDVGSEDCVEEDYMGVTFDERGCDLITIYTQIDTFSATADECYKLRITYEILNWCEYNGETDPYVIPRDADDDDDLEEATYLHVEPNDETDLGDDTAELDRDNNPDNNFTTGDKSFIAFLDVDDEPGLVQGTNEDEGYGDDDSRGAFLYRQFIKVYDEDAPILVIVEPDGPGLDNDGDCLGNIDLEFSVDDDCSPGSIGLTASLNPFVEDANDDGFITLNEFVPGSDITDALTSLGNGTYEINLTDLPLGRHAVRIRATDGCGNTAVKLIVFEIADNKAPTPICINGLTVTLMPDGEGGGMGAIWVSDFIASPSTDCAGEVKYAIYRATTAAAPGFEPNPLDTGLVLNCDDDATTIVRIYAIDPNGQADYCETTLLVQFFQPDLCNGGDGGSLAGTIMTESAGVVPGVNVSISGDANAQTVTDASGTYTFSDLVSGDDYTVAAEYENYQYHINGVSTFDLVLISKHILGLDELTSPYGLLAADANNDQNISVQDIIAIRRLILGLDNAYRSSPAWRFVDASFDFPVNGNPWATNFPEVYNVNNLPGNVVNGDFIAVMVGNVDANGLDNLQNGSTDRTNGQYGLRAAEKALVAGNTYEVAFTAADAQLEGFQGTLNLGEELEFVAIEAAALTAGNFNTNYAERGWINFSYVAEEELTAEKVLFSLIVRANANAQLSEVLSIGDELINAEAYTLEAGIQQLGINFNGEDAVAGFELLQNTPNPVADLTTVGFHLPAAAEVSFLVQDVSGRVVLNRSLEGVSGYNSITLTRDELNASGMLTYTITSGAFTATKKMLLVK